jgi:hypothetical protein
MDVSPIDPTGRNMFLQALLPRLRPMVAAVTRGLVIGGLAIGGLATAPAAEAASFQHVVIISIDGLHESDLTDPATAQYLPNMLSLLHSGVSYTSASTSLPSDEFPGTLAIITGASPKSTGVFYDDNYSRDYWPPGTTAAQITAGTLPGTQVHIPNAELNGTLLSGGGVTSGSGAYGKSAINPAGLLVESSGNVVEPWQYSRVNTIFDITTAAGLTSGFMGKHPAGDTTFLGPTGNAVTDYYAPESDATTAIINGVLVDPSTAPAGTPTGENVNQLGDTGGNYEKMEAWDNLLKTGTLNELSGKIALGTAPLSLPAVIYLNLQSVDVAQKLLSNNTGLGGINVMNGAEVVGPALASALQHSDQIVGAIVSKLKAIGIYNNTAIVLTATHGNAPRLNSATLVNGTIMAQALANAGVTIGQMTQDDVAIMWLANQSQTALAQSILAAYAKTHSEVKAVLPGSQFGSPTTDSRTPDFLVQLNEGFIYFGCEGENYPGNGSQTVSCALSYDATDNNTHKRVEHGDINIDDVNVPIIVSGGALASWQQGLTVSTPVSTTQIAPTVLSGLGLNAGALDGVQLEGTQVLPNALP